MENNTTSKRFTAILCAFVSVMLVICMSVWAPASASALSVSQVDASTTPTETVTKQTLVIDEYNLFDASTRAALEARAQDISAAGQCNTYLLVVDDIGSVKVRDYAKNYYIANDLGYGSKKSGILFLIAVDSRDYVTITYGFGTTLYTDYEIEALEDDVVSELSGDNWVKAAEKYYDQCNRATEFYNEKGVPLDYDNDPVNKAIGGAIGFAIAIAAGAGVAIFGTRKHTKALKTAVEKTEALAYVPSSGLSITHASERFTGTTVVAVPISRNDSSGSRGGSTIDSGGFGGSSGGKF